MDFRTVVIKTLLNEEIIVESKKIQKYDPKAHKEASKNVDAALGKMDAATNDDEYLKHLKTFQKHRKILDRHESLKDAIPHLSKARKNEVTKSLQKKHGKNAVGGESGVEVKHETHTDSFGSPELHVVHTTHHEPHTDGGTVEHHNTYVVPVTGALKHTGHTAYD